MYSYIDVLFTPAEFQTLPQQDLTDTACVVFDVLRATSVMVTALYNGAEALVPVREISEAVEYAKTHRGVLLAGERHGLRITTAESGGTEFHLGNSPREFIREKVAGRTIVTTTTNGTRALTACGNAKETLVCSFLNLTVTASYLHEKMFEHVLIVCSGTCEEAAYEDALAAGALLHLLNPADHQLSDSAQIALNTYATAGDLAQAIRKAKNARRLLRIPSLASDVAYSLTRDSHPILVHQHKGLVMVK